MKYKLDDELKNILISNLIFYREQMGLSQYSLAEKIGVTQAYIAKIEKGEKEMSITVFNKISNVLGVSMNTLLSADKDNVTIQNINAMLNGKSEQNLKAMERMVKFYMKELENR